MAAGLGSSRRGRLTPRHRRLLQLAFDAFQKDAAWPQVARLQHELARQGDRFAIRGTAKDLDPSLGRANSYSPNGEVVLSIKGVRRCSGAEQVLGDFVRVIGYFVKRYLEAPIPPAEVTSSDLQRDLEISGVSAHKMRLLLDSSNVPTAGGGGSEDSWRWLIDDQILRFRDAATIDRVIRSAYPPGWPGTAGSAAVSQRADVGLPSGVVDWPASAPGWGSVEARLSGLHTKLADASTKDDWQDIGRRCREIVIEAANVVFTPRLVPAGGEVPGTNDAKARLDAYFEARLPELADELRAFVAGSWRLANALTHHPRMGRLEAVSSAQAVILLVRVLQEFDRTPGKHRRSPGGRRQAAGRPGTEATARSTKHAPEL